MTSILTGNPLARFVHGFMSPFRAFGFIRRNPSLYSFVIMPFFINAITFTLVVYYGMGAIFDWVMARLPQGDAWYWLILNYFVMAIAIGVVLVLVFFTFAAVGSLIASPFNDLLSERTEMLITGKGREETFTFRGVMWDAWRTLILESKKIAIFLVGMLLLLLLHLVPVLGSALYPFLTAAWTVLFLIIEYTGYVFARRRIDFSAQRQLVFRYAAPMFGFGTGLFCLLAIPFLQLLCIPLGVVGAVRLLDDVKEL